MLSSVLFCEVTLEKNKISIESFIALLQSIQDVLDPHCDYFVFCVMRQQFTFWKDVLGDGSGEPMVQQLRKMILRSEGPSLAFGPHRPHHKDVLSQGIGSRNRLDNYVEHKGQNNIVSNGRANEQGRPLAFHTGRSDYNNGEDY